MKLSQLVMASAFTMTSIAAFAGGDYSHDNHKNDHHMNKDNSDAYTFEQFDQNNNGKLEKTEIMETNVGRNLDGTRFETIDTNSNGVVSRSEWKQFTNDEQS